MLPANDNRRGEFSGSFEVVCSSNDRDGWLQARAFGIGASEMAAVMGLNQYESALHVYARKIGAVQPDESAVGEAAYWGNRLEAIVIDEFGIRSGKETFHHGELLRSTKYPWALATLDAVVFPDGVPLEAKTAREWLMDDWTDGTPVYYQVQCHQQMLVTGAPRVYAACLVGGQRFIWDVVERDESLISKIIVAGEDFWSRVQNQSPPDPDGSESAERALRALVAERSEELDERPELDPVLLTAAEQLAAVQSSLSDVNRVAKGLQDQRSELQQKIRLAMNGSKYAQLGEWVFVDEVRKRGSYTVQEASWHELKRTTYEEAVAKLTKGARKTVRRRAV